MALALGISTSCKTCKAKREAKKATAQTESVKKSQMDELNGTWELSIIAFPGSNETYVELYKEKKPTVTFNVKELRINGNTSCNNFNGTFKVNGNTINLSENFAMTKMMCPGNGERKFLEEFQKVNKYAVSGDQLMMMIDDMVMMQFIRK